MKTGWHQSGAVTLLMSLIILLSLTTIVFTGAKSTRMEQLISNNEYRALEAFHAAEAGLEYGIRWLANNQPTWVAGTCNQNLTINPPALSVSSGNTYNQTVTFCQNTATKGYVLVRSTAVSAQDSNVTAKVQQYVRPNTILNPGYTLNAPPMVVNGCVSGITGNPSVDPGTSGGVALATSKPQTCVNTGHLDILNSGTIAYSAFNNTAWQYIFGTFTKTQLQTLSATEVSAQSAGQMSLVDRHYFWITDSSNWHQNLGSASHAVVLAFSAASGCPKVNGGVTIYGVVYYEDPSCGNQGWGGATIYGTAAFEGNLTKLTANSVVKKFSMAGGGMGIEETLPYTGAPKILGTWKDF
ncbi:MAG: hypothetical protein HQL74_13850 [Magnetococcales bacterium]|nr:hypothetical protein [Magnetococcales bacterium]